MTRPINQLEHLTVHFGSPAHCLPYQKRDTVGPCLSCVAQKMYQKRMNVPHILICTLGCMFILKLTGSVPQREKSDKWMLTSIWEKKKSCAYKAHLFSVATLHGQSFSWTYQKVMKNTTPRILSLKRTCQIGIKSGISLLLVLREHLTNSTQFFFGYENVVFSFTAFLGTISSFYVLWG